MPSSPNTHGIAVVVPSHSMLAGWVEQIWILESSLPITERVYGTGKPQLLLHGGTAFVEALANGEVRRQPAVCVSGQLTCFRDVTAPAGTRSIGIVLHPAALRAFVDAPAALVRDGEAPSADLGPCMRSLASLPLSEMPTAELLARIEECLLRGMRRDVQLGTARRLVSSIQRCPSVAALLHETGWSERKLQRFFADYVGLSPRAFLSSTRLTRAVELLRTRDAAAVAVQAGYFDQAHFIKACKHHTGYTPGEYARICWGRG
jgi:AraC-like DNA-binding protein